MLPYFDEYCDRCEKSASLKVYVLRLRKLNVIKENVFDMSAEEIVDIIDAKNTKPSTLNAFYSSFDDYLMWVHRTYNVSIADIYYQLNRLRELATKICNSNLNEILFSDFTELKKVLLKAEDEESSIKEHELSEQELDTLYLNQKKYNAFIVFVWNGLSDEEMMSLTLKDVITIITSGQITVGDKTYTISEDEKELLNEAYQSIMDIKESEKHRPYKKSRYKRKREAWTYDNLFNTTSKKSLNNFRYLAIGRVSDPRLNKPTIIKSGIFYRMNQYEKENDYLFFGMEGSETYKKLSGVSFSTAQRIVSEYNEYKQSVEQAKKEL